MALSNLSLISISWVAFATGITGFLALVAIILFFTVGQPFGSFNDFFNGLMAILSGTLAWITTSLYYAQPPLLSQISLILALVGSLIAVIGSVLVIFKFTGWVLAGLYTVTGYALIGLWLLGLVYSLQNSSSVPQSLVIFGVVIGVIMAFGFAAIPGIIRSVDSLESLPRIINYIWQAGSLGWLVLYPIWCIWFGRILTQAVE